MKSLTKALSLFFSALIVITAINGCFKKANDTVSTPTETTAPVEESVNDSNTSPQSNTSPSEDELWIKELINLKHELRFNEDGKFKILFLADVQSYAIPLEKNVQENIKILVDREDPDLVLFLGDNSVFMRSAYDFHCYLESVVWYIEEKNIPWAHVYGNHDDEDRDNIPTLSKDAQQKIYQSFEWCISDDEEALSGVGNYVLPILHSDSNDIGFNIWNIDSGTYIPDEMVNSMFPDESPYKGYEYKAYDYIHPDQIDWYKDTSKRLEEYYGKKIDSIMHFHIPLQENYTAWLNHESLTYTGNKSEGIGASAINSGLFINLLERGDVVAVVNGHDHNNDYAIDYCGIKLCACATISTAAYHMDDLLGGRVMIIDENDTKSITTYMSYIENTAQN